MLNQLPNDQLDAILLWYLVQHSLTSYRKLELYFGSITQAIQTENLPRWVELKLHKNHIENDSRSLQHKIQVFFQEEIHGLRMIIIQGLGKKHQSDKKSITRIIQKLLIGTLEINRKGIEYHHQQ